MNTQDKLKKLEEEIELLKGVLLNLPARIEKLENIHEDEGYITLKPKKARNHVMIGK